MIIRHNMNALFVNRTSQANGKQVTSNIEKLSTGYRINKAGDDASGLAVSEKMRSQIRGLQQAQKNAENGVSFIQTAEGYLQESQDILHRIREIAIQSANGIYTSSDRVMIQVEVSALVDEVDRIASHAQFNGMNLLTGRFAQVEASTTEQTGIWFHIGANMDQREQAFIGDMTAKSLKLRDDQKNMQISISNANVANKTIGVVDKALETISKQRADLGSYQNRFEHTSLGLAVGAENLQAAESKIRDVDMASEIVDFTKNQILAQSSMAMLAQANLQPQMVLRLLG